MQILKIIVFSYKSSHTYVSVYKKKKAQYTGVRENCYFPLARPCLNIFAQTPLGLGILEIATKKRSPGKSIYRTIMVQQANSIHTNNSCHIRYRGFGFFPGISFIFIFSRARKWKIDTPPSIYCLMFVKV